MIKNSRVCRFKVGDKVRIHEEAKPTGFRIGEATVTEVHTDPIPLNERHLLGHSARYSIYGFSYTLEDWMLELVTPANREQSLDEVVAEYKLNIR